MDSTTLQHFLDGLAIGPQRYFDQIGSTNVEAAAWADAGASDLALVLADEQIAGKGRQGRKWFTPPGSALAFSLVLRETIQAEEFPAYLGRYTALGALAVCQALQADYHLPAQIKWPNDVLIQRRKVAGVLVEAHWQAGELTALILGIGVNVTRQAAPADEEVLFPATCIETHLGYAISRPQLLRRIIQRLLYWRSQLGKPEFLLAWEEQLAFRDEWVTLVSHAGHGNNEVRGQVSGLDAQGRLRLRTQDGQIFLADAGEVHLRVPVE